MSQLLHVHINQRLMKSSSAENSPGSPGLSGGLSPGGSLSGGGPSSPQGMPIPRRDHLSGLGHGGQHWTSGLCVQSNNPNLGQTVMWNGMAVDTGIEAMELGGGGQSDYMMMDHHMEGGLSKLSMAVDDDDIFKVERSDLLGPTLAELNAPDADTLLDGLNFDDLYWPPDPLGQVDATPSPQTPGGGPVDPLGVTDDFVSLQVQHQHQHPSSSFPQSGMNKMPILGAGSVPVPMNILDIQPLYLNNDFNPVPSPSATASGGINPQSSTSISGAGGGLRELLLRRDLQNSMDSSTSTQDQSPLGQSLPRSMLTPSPGSLSPRLSTSAPTGQGGNPWETWQQRREAVWNRRDPRPHLLSTGSLAEAGSTSSLVSADVLSPGREFSLSMDEGFDSDDVSDRDSSDEDSDASETESNAGSSSGNRRERYFWQYNVQAKGPKGQRLVLAPTQEDPHVLQRPTDPVFSPLCHIQGIKHSGKARKGDGNDLTPNPKKLFTIGKELDRLNKVISDMTPVADVPNAVKSRSRKEKNKLASRACRLKKKAQHEANKLKLFGLEQEHKRLMQSIEQARQAVFQRMDGGPDLSGESLASKVDRISKTTTRQKIGGHTTEFVNRVLDKVKQGIPDGGISDL